MIKFLKKADNGLTLIRLGLSEENIKRLQANDPIYFDLNQLGIEGYHVFIMAGKDEKSMTETIEKHFGKAIEKRGF